MCVCEAVVQGPAPEGGVEHPVKTLPGEQAQNCQQMRRQTVEEWLELAGLPPWPVNPREPRLRKVFCF